jgi:hypothetical protein
MSVDEILNTWPDYKCKDVLLSTKSGSSGDPSGRDPRMFLSKSGRKFLSPKKKLFSRHVF